MLWDVFGKLDTALIFKWSWCVLIWEVCLYASIVFQKRKKNNWQRIFCKNESLFSKTFERAEHERDSMEIDDSALESPALCDKSKKS